MRRRTSGLQWPEHLDICDPERWAEDGRPGGDLWMLKAWNRWVDARLDHLIGVGYAHSDAQFMAAEGDFPAGIDGRRTDA